MSIGGDLSGLVDQVFNQGKNPSQPATSAPSSEDDANLDALISSVFHPDENPGSSSPSTILGTDNQKNNKPTDCECVPYYQCQNNSILDNGIGLIDIRSSFPGTISSTNTRSNG